MLELVFTDFEDHKVKVSIACDAENDGTIELSADPVILTEDNSDDYFMPVRCWSGYINFACISPDMAIMLTSQPYEVTITIDDRIVRFFGYVRCESFTASLFDTPMSFNLPIECPLSKLKRIDFDCVFQNTTLQSLAEECIRASLPRATVNMEEYKGYYSTKINKVVFGSWNEETLKWECDKTYYAVLCACMLPLGYTVRISGTTVTAKPGLAQQAIPLESIASSFYGTDQKFSITRPAKNIVMEAGGETPKAPRFMISDAKLGNSVQTSITADSKWIVTYSYSNAEPYYDIQTYRKNGAGAVNLVNRYRQNKSNWLGGAVVQSEGERGEFESSTSMNFIRSLIITRSMDNKQKPSSGEQYSEPIARFRTTMPTTYLFKNMYLKGTVKGMPDSDVSNYRWSNNCAGAIACKIKFGNKWLVKSGNITDWSSAEAMIFVPIGSNGEEKEASDEPGFLGMSDKGFIIPPFGLTAPDSLLPEALLVEVTIYGFGSLNNNNIFAKITDLELSVEDDNLYYEIKKTEKANYAGDEDYTIRLDAVAKSHNSFIDLGMDFNNIPIFDMAKTRQSKPNMRMDLAFRGGSYTQAVNYTYKGKQFAVVAQELHLRDRVTKATMLEI